MIKSEKYRLHLIISLLTIMVICGCRRQPDNYVPNVSVNITLYPGNPQYFRLNAIGGVMTISGGVRGIIVYRKSQTDFVALDRNCSVNSSNACAVVEVDSSTNVYAFCRCCNSQFILTDGSVSRAPATLPLKSYFTSFDGNALVISN